MNMYVFDQVFLWVHSMNEITSSSTDCKSGCMLWLGIHAYSLCTISYGVRCMLACTHSHTHTRTHAHTHTHTHTHTDDQRLGSIFNHWSHHYRGHTVSYHSHLNSIHKASTREPRATIKCECIQSNSG